MWYSLKGVKCNFSLLFKNIHIRLSTLKIYFNKYLFFYIVYYLLYTLILSRTLLVYFLHTFSPSLQNPLIHSLSLSKTQHNPKSPSNQPPSMEQPTIIKQLATISPFSHHQHINPTLITLQNTQAIAAFILAMFTKTQLQPIYSRIFSKHSLNY